MSKSKWDFRAKPFDGEMTGSPTGTDWAAPVGAPIPQITTGTIRSSLLKTDRIIVSVNPKHHEMTPFYRNIKN